MREHWLEIPEFPRYLVSNLGRVVNRLNDRVLIQSPDSGGYLRVKLYNSFDRFSVSVHRLVTGTFYDVDLSELEVNHLDGDKQNNHLWNLEVCTRSENMKHAYATGLSTVPKETRVLCVETGEVFRTLRAAARSIGVSDHKAIMRVLDKPNLSARGFHFESVVLGGDAQNDH